MSLRGGVADRGWLHVSATHQNMREFVESIASGRLGGKLGASDLDSVVEYVGKGIPKLQSPRVDPVKAAHGQQIFGTYCAGCHAGPAHTSGVKANGTPRIFNIGMA